MHTGRAGQLCTVDPRRWGSASAPAARRKYCRRRSTLAVECRADRGRGRAGILFVDANLLDPPPNRLGFGARRRGGILCLQLFRGGGGDNLPSARTDEPRERTALKMHGNDLVGLVDGIGPVHGDGSLRDGFVLLRSALEA